jgi:hypothetical protein
MLVSPPLLARRLHSRKLRVCTHTSCRLQDGLKAARDAVACRDAAIADLQAQLAGTHASLLDHAAARDAHAEALCERDRQLAAAQARLAQVAPIMRRLAVQAGS